jgi:hypothetical protein
VTADYDPDRDYTRYRTWDWVENPGGNSENARTDSPLVRARILSAVEESLAGRDFLRTGSDPDFLVNYHLSIDEKMDTETVDTYYDQQYDMHLKTREKVEETVVYEWEEGTLILDILDPEAKGRPGTDRAQPHPRGAAEASPEGRGPDDREVPSLLSSGPGGPVTTAGWRDGRPGPMTGAWSSAGSSPWPFSPTSSGSSSPTRSTSWTG